MRRSAHAALALAVALAAGPRPARAELPAWTPPEPVVRTFSNGLRVAVFRDPRLPIVQMQMVVPAGVVQEPSTGAGLASLTAALLTRGTTSRSAADLAAEVERVGGTLTASATRDYATIGGSFLARDFEVGLDLLGDVVLNPVFPLEEVDRVRTATVSQLLQSRQNPGVLADDHLWAVAFQGHPYGRPVQGALASLPDLRRSNVQQFHRDFYRPDHALLAIAGDVDPEQAFAAVESQFGGWSGSARPVPAAEPSRNPGTRIRIVDAPGLAVAEVRLGRIGPPRSDPDYAALQLAGQVLGGSSASRLYASVRGAQSAWSWQRQASLAMLAATARPESAAAVVGRLRAELARIAGAAPADSELAAARKVLRNGFRIQFDQLASAPAQWLAGGLSGLGADHPARYLEALDRVAVLPAARKWLAPEGLAVVVVGPAARMRAGLESLGAVEVVTASADPAVVATLPSTDRTPATPGQQEAGRRAVDQAVAAHGGRAKLRGILDSTIEGEMTLHSPAGDAKGAMKQVRREPFQFFSEVQFDRGRTTQVLNGAQAWALAGAAGDSVVDEDTLAVAALRAGFLSDPHHVLMMAADPGSKLALRGRETIGGRDLDAVELVTADGERHVLFFDPSTRQLAGVEQNERSLRGTVSVRRLFSDYRLTEGIAWPYVEERQINGERAMTLITRRVDFNSKVDEGRFRHPSETAGPAWRR